MKTNRFRKFFLLMFCLFNLLNYAQTDSLKHQITNYVQKIALTNKSKFFLLVQNKKGESSFYGFDGRTRLPINNFNFTYEIGSCTKMFTATAIFKLIEDKKLSLEDKLVEILPNPELYENLLTINGKDYISKVKLLDLLHHSSGFPDYFVSPDSLELKISGDASLLYTPEQLIKRAKRINKPFFEPGTNQFKYSNVNYILLGLIIEKVTGLKYEKYIEKNIIKPLKLKNTYFGTRMVPINLLQGHYKGRFSEMPYSMAWSAGEIISSLDDMAVFINHWYNGQFFKDKKLMDIILKDYYNDMGMGIKYGLGNIKLMDKSWGHGGQTFGFVSYVGVLPNGYSFVLGLDDASADSWSPAIWLTMNLK